MANRLKMAEVQTILTLHQQGLSNRKIGEITGFHRETVGRYVKLENSKPAKAPPGSDEKSSEGDPRDPVASNGARSQCEPHREFIERGLERGLSAKRIHQDLSEQLGGQAPSYYSVRRFVARLFESVERPALLALPSDRFPFFHESTRKVHRDGHVEVDKAYYSVRPEYVGRRVWVRWDARTVRIFDDRDRVRCWLRHRESRSIGLRTGQSVKKALLQ